MDKRPVGVNDLPLAIYALENLAECGIPGEVSPQSDGVDEVTDQTG